MDNQIFPSNVEMEKQILSALLIRNGESVPKINAILSAEDFFRPEHKIRRCIHKRLRFAKF